MIYLFKISFRIIIFLAFSISVKAQLKNSSSKHIIEIKNMKFVPSELEIKKGDTVVWINRDIFIHNITEIENNKWASSNLSQDESWSMIVTENLNYYCSLHIVMKGKLIIIK